MLFRSFAHWLLIIFGGVVLLTVCFLAIKIGWFGQASQELLARSLLPMQDLYYQNKSDFDFAGKVIGAVGTAIGAAWTVHRGWHYAERNLPERLKEYNARWHDKIVDSRPRNLPMLAQIVSIEPEHAAELGWFRSLFSKVHDPAQWAVAQLKEEIAERESSFAVLKTSKVRCRAEIVSRSLALGYWLSQTRKDHDALKAFEKALSFNRTDLDALELAAKQAYALNHSGIARTHLEDLVKAAERTGQLIRRARAVRFKAEVLKGSTRTSWGLARDELKASIAMLTASDTFKDNDKNLELALTYGQLADIQALRGSLFAARRAYNAARLHSEGISPPLAGQVGHALDKINDRIVQAEQDMEEDTGDNEGEV